MLNVSDIKGKEEVEQMFEKLFAEILYFKNGIVKQRILLKKDIWNESFISLL